MGDFLRLSRIEAEEQIKGQDTDIASVLENKCSFLVIKGWSRKVAQASFSLVFLRLCECRHPNLLESGFSTCEGERVSWELLTQSVLSRLRQDRLEGALQYDLDADLAGEFSSCGKIKPSSLF